MNRNRHGWKLLMFTLFLVSGCQTAPVPPIVDVPLPPNAPAQPAAPATSPETEADSSPVRLLVRYRDGADIAAMDATDAAAGVNGVVCRFSACSQLVVVEVPARSAETALARYRSDPNVEHAEDDSEVSAFEMPNDSRASELWGLKNTGQLVNGSAGLAGADIRAEGAWNVTTGSEAVLIGVIDTGIDFEHPDLASNIWTNPGEIPGNGIDDDHNGFVDDVHGYNFVTNSGDTRDDNGHGTHVAGIIGAVGDNGLGVVGVSRRCKLIALKFLGASGSGRVSDAIRAIDYCVRNNIRLSNNSWGTQTSESAALREAIERAGMADHLFVAAAGNAGSDNDVRPVYPASYPLGNIISVAASDNADRLAWFSCYGKRSVHIAAPGKDILSCARGGDYVYLSGTSMAAPYVTGVIALLSSVRPAFSAAQLRERVVSSTRPVESLRDKIASGGVLNAAAVVQFEQPAPQPPTDLRLAGAAPREMDITFSHSGADVSRFELEVGTNGANFAPAAQVTAEQRAIHITGLQPATSYYLRLRACNSAGCSTYSNVLQASTPAEPQPPTVPTNLASGDVGTRSIEVRFSHSGVDVGRFELESSADGINFEFAEQAAAGQRSITAVNLQPATNYYFRLRACNDVGCSSYSDVIQIVTLAEPPAPRPPTAPANLRAGSVGTRQLEVRFDHSGFDVTRFELELGLDGVDFSTSAAAPPSDRSITIQNLQPATTYFIRLRACNDAGCSDYASGLQITTQADVPPPQRPTAPANLVASDVWGTVLDVHWSDRSNNETGFQVELSANGSSWSLYATAAANTERQRVMSLQANTRYWFRVRAFNDAGASGYSNVLTVVTGPRAPSNLRCTDMWGTTMDIRWDDNSGNEDGFHVGISTDGGANWTHMTDVGPNVTTYRIENLQANSPYCVRVRGFNANGTSDVSNILCGTTGPVAPTNLRAVNIWRTKIDLRWNDNSDNETAFRVGVSSNGGASWTALDPDTAANQVTRRVENLQPNTIYQFRVRALNANGRSDVASVLEVRTKP